MPLPILMSGERSLDILSFDASYGVPIHVRQTVKEVATDTKAGYFMKEEIPTNGITGLS